MQSDLKVYMKKYLSLDILIQLQGNSLSKRGLLEVGC